MKKIKIKDLIPIIILEAMFFGFILLGSMLAAGRYSNPINMTRVIVIALIIWSIHLIHASWSIYRENKDD